MQYQSRRRISHGMRATIQRLAIAKTKKANPRKRQHEREHQIKQVTKSHANTGLDFVTLPIKEIKRGKTSFLLDTGATQTRQNW